MADAYRTIITIELVTPGKFRDIFTGDEDDFEGDGWSFDQLQSVLARGPGRGKVSLSESVLVKSDEFPDFILPPVYCDFCAMPFSVAEWDDRHSPDDYPMAEVHSYCCTTCNHEETS